jgi:vacuolar-type H+-ATPase subunit I/STV1
MKKALLFVGLAFLFLGSPSLAQLSKAEKKEWKKKAKQYSKNPESLKQLTDEKQTAESTVSSQKSQITGLQREISDKDARIAELEDQLSRMRGDLTSARAELARLKEAPPPVASNDYSQGLWFKVQIGAFKNKDLTKYFENNPNFGGEVIDGTQRITIGVFKDYWEADIFKKYLREMGVKDAWIIPYKDGVRVDIKDVLEGVVKEKPQTEGK